MTSSKSNYMATQETDTTTSSSVEEGTENGNNELINIVPFIAVGLVVTYFILRKK